MKPNSLINQINMACDNKDLATARVYMENNIDIISSPPYYSFLNDNARELLKIVQDSKRSGLTRKQKSLVLNFNKLVGEYDITKLRIYIKAHKELLQMEESQEYLNSSARLLLKELGDILGMTSHKH